MPRKRPKAASFPSAFLELFLKVAESRESVVFNNLENRRAAYTTFRAKLSEFRKSYYEEAKESGNPHLIAVAESLYQVTIRDPEQVNGKWQMELSLRGAEYTDVISEVIGEIPSEIDVPILDPILDDGEAAIAIAEFAKMKADEDRE